MKPRYETGVIHGRFQVLHNDHLAYLLAGKELCRHLVVGITNPSPDLTCDESVDPARSSMASNPLTYYERARMTSEVLAEAGVDRAEFSVVPLPINLPEQYRHFVPMDAVFFLTIYDDWGRRKLEYITSQGLKTHILWERPLEDKGITGTQVRRAIRTNQNIHPLVPPATARFVEQWDVAGRLAG